MKEKSKPVERDREATEQRLIDTIGQMVAEQGFEKIGINAVAAQSGVSKILIYRYFGSVEGLMAAYIRKHDFWLNFPLETPTEEELPDFIKTMFKNQIEQLRSNPTLRMLHRWELSCNNEIITKLRQQREQTGYRIVEMASQLTGYPKEEMAVMASVVTASITYLVMLGEFCPVFNGIPINEDAGWEQMNVGIDTLIDKVLRA